MTFADLASHGLRADRVLARASTTYSTRCTTKTSAPAAPKPSKKAEEESASSDSD